MQKIEGPRQHHRKLVAGVHHPRNGKKTRNESKVATHPRPNNSLVVTTWLRHRIGAATEEQLKYDNR